MKIRIVHFSDFHAKAKNDAPLLDATKVVTAVRAIGDADAYIIVASGDLAFSGKEEEYALVADFMKYFFSDDGFNRKRKLIDYLYVPGNHDIDFASGKIAKSSEEFKEMYGLSIRNNKLDIENISKDYHNAMYAFFTFAEKGNCKWHDRTINKRTIDIDGFKLAFTLVNSATFSMLGGDGEDKGCHRLTEKQLEIIRDIPKADFNCLIMHHGVEWFADETKTKLRDILAEEYVATLVGHEHDVVTEKRVINDREPCCYIQSNAFKDSTLKDNGFCVVDIDSTTKHMDVYSFVRKNNIYIHSPVLSTSIKKYSVKGIRNNEDFQASLTLDQNGTPYEDYYCFPRIECRSFDENNNPTVLVIQTETEFTEFLLGKSRVSISGDQKAGKSLLTKRIYKNMIENGIVPILFDATIHNMNKKYIVENIFKNQYRTDNYSFERFRQLRMDQRVAIIDDADLITPNSLKSFIDLLGETFGSVIVFHKTEPPTDLEKQVLDAIDDNHKLTILPFTYSLRKELIANRLSVKGIDANEVELKTTQINDLIHGQVKFFSLNPEFIIYFVDLYERDTKSQATSGKAAFSMVYEHAIKDKLIKHCQNSSPEIILTIIQNIAYSMHFGKKRSITEKELQEHIETYREEYRQKISFSDFITTVKDSGFLIENEHHFSFRDRSHLAYFVAGAINQKSTDPSSPEYEDAEINFKYLLDNLCFGINSDIVLFLSVVTNNTQFINIIIQKAAMFFYEKEELCFRRNNVPFITNANIQVKSGLPGNDDKKQREESISRTEIEIKNSDVIEPVDEYDYLEEDAKLEANQLILAFRYLEILSKTLPAFCVKMKIAQQDALVNLIYRCPNKFLYMLLKKIDDNLDEFIENIYIDANKNQDGQSIDKKSIRVIVEQISACVVIALYHLVASTNASRETILALNDFEEIEDNSNYSILNFMFNARLCGINQLAKIAIPLDKTCKLPIEHSLITYAVRDFYMRNEVPLRGNGLSVADHFFGEAARKPLQIEMGKKKLRRKE